MKLIIEIDENVYTRLFDNGIPMDFADGIVMERAIRNGTPIPETATNGDVIKAMFPNMKADVGGGVIRADRYTQFDLSWWNSLYQKGGK